MARLWASFFLAFVLGCAPSATQLIVVVDTDLRVPSELHEVRVRVTGPGGTSETEMETLPSGEELPLTLTVIAETPDGPLSPVRVVAEGYLDGMRIVDREASVSFVRNETRVVVMHLVRACVGRTDCGAGRTCTESGCRAIEIPELPVWPGPPTRLDAGPDAPMRDAPGADVPDGGTPDAGPPCIEDSECDDRVPCTADTCNAGGCVHAPRNAMCDDGNRCTDDVCGGSGCMGVPNTVPCEEPTGDFCDGMGVCSGGACVQPGNPCPAPTVCNEAMNLCDNCGSRADCPVDTTGAWTGCDHTDGCDEAGMRSRTDITYDCVSTRCVPTPMVVTDTAGCARETDGTTCGVGSCGGFGACDYADGCDEAAMRTQTCTDLLCQAGTCRAVDRTNSDTSGCVRDTDGMMCSATSCGSYGSCDHSDACDEAAMRTRTCTDFRCAAGSCGGTMRTESDTAGCNRSTSGTSCGATTCGGYGSCDHSGPCDEDGTRTRTCTDAVCGGGSCGSSMRSESDTAGCVRDTDGMSCGAGLACRAGACVSCAPTLSGSVGGVGMFFARSVTGSGNTLTFVDGMMSGSITVSSGVTFSGSFTASVGINRVVASGNTLQFFDWDPAMNGTITVTGATVSGTFAPACIPIMMGCIPATLVAISGSGSVLTLTPNIGTAETITFGCP